METSVEMTTEAVPLKQLRKDMKEAAKLLTKQEARFLVDYYYQQQEHRIATEAQVRTLKENGEPAAAMAVISEQTGGIEKNIRYFLDKYSANDPLGEWARAQVGIGPVLAAGLLAHIDITRAETAGHIWAFAGLDNRKVWLGKEKAEKIVSNVIVGGGTLEDAMFAISSSSGTRIETIRRLASTDREGKPVKVTKATITAAGAKRPWNATLKVLCWKIGESFVKVSGNPDAFYGRIYAERKVLEQSRNAAGAFADAAAGALAAKKYRSETKAKAAYEAGILPDAHVHARAKRYAVKLFLAHFWETGRKLAGLPVPLPYPIAQLGHAHLIAPPDPVA